MMTYQVQRIQMVEIETDDHECNDDRAVEEANDLDQWETVDVQVVSARLSK